MGSTVSSTSRARSRMIGGAISDRPRPSPRCERARTPRSEPEAARTVSSSRRFDAAGSAGTDRSCCATSEALGDVTGREDGCGHVEEEEHIDGTIGVLLRPVVDAPVSLGTCPIIWARLSEASSRYSGPLTVFGSRYRWSPPKEARWSSACSSSIRRARDDAGEPVLRRGTATHRAVRVPRVHERPHVEHYFHYYGGYSPTRSSSWRPRRLGRGRCGSSPARCSPSSTTP